METGHFRKPWSTIEVEPWTVNYSSLKQAPSFRRIAFGIYAILFSQCWALFSKLNFQPVRYFYMFPTLLIASCTLLRRWLTMSAAEEWLYKSQQQWENAVCHVAARATTVLFVSCERFAFRGRIFSFAWGTLLFYLFRQTSKFRLIQPELQGCTSQIMWPDSMKF